MNELLRINLLLKPEHMKALRFIAEKYRMSGNSNSEIVRCLIEYEMSKGKAEQYFKDHSEKYGKAPIPVKKKKKRRAKDKPSQI